MKLLNILLCLTEFDAVQDIQAVDTQSLALQGKNLAVAIPLAQRGSVI